MELTCYLDDSRGEGIHAVGGYLTRSDVWADVFSPFWSELLARAPHPISEFKAASCRHLTGEFQNWTREEANAFTRKCLDLIAAEPLKLNGFGAGMLLPEAPSREETKQRHQRAYMLCFLSIMLNVVQVVRAIDGAVEDQDFSIRFICDNQPGIEGRLGREFDEARELVAPDCPFEIGHLEFADSRRVPGLQAADILAYETRKDLKSRLDEHRRTRSKALQFLLDRRPHVAFYLDDRVIAFMYEDFEKGAPGPLPLLYASQHISGLMTWATNSKIRMEPEALVPTSRESD